MVTAFCVIKIREKDARKDVSQDIIRLEEPKAKKFAISSQHKSSLMLPSLQEKLHFHTCNILTNFSLQ